MVLLASCTGTGVRLSLDKMINDGMKNGKYYYRASFTLVGKRFEY